MDTELSTHLGQRQARLVELYGVINLDLGHGLTTHRRADIAQKPEHTALAKPVPLRELSRRNASVVVGDKALHGIGIETLSQLVAKPVSAFLAMAFGPRPHPCQVVRVSISGGIGVCIADNTSRW